VTAVQQSQQTSNLYYDVTFQVSNVENKTIHVMHQKGDGSKRQLFRDKMTAQQPIKLSNMPVSISGTIFLNKGTIIKDVSPHSVPFTYQPMSSKEITSIIDLKNHLSGMFTVSGLIQWSGPPHKPTQESTKLVRDGTITNSSGMLKLSVWEEHIINQVKEGEYFMITDCKLRFYYGKCLSTMPQNKETNQKGHSFDVRQSRRHIPAYTRERAAAMFLVVLELLLLEYKWAILICFMNILKKR
jgi:hypothetical protein